PTPTATPSPTPTPTQSSTPTSSPTQPTTPPTTSRPGLPNTGTAVGPLLGLAAGSLVLGGGLVLAGRRRIGDHR
ncbi:MAG: LPXTG cell wall anchor domain-containing protein, partial [Actinomycetota bacterium]|nr:LPXTG cell wall anchor domain-containing protein [Actinomycetota bacterium]